MKFFSDEQNKKIKVFFVLQILFIFIISILAPNHFEILFIKNLNLPMVLVDTPPRLIDSARNQKKAPVASKMLVSKILKNAKKTTSFAQVKNSGGFSSRSPHLAYEIRRGPAISRVDQK